VGARWGALPRLESHGNGKKVRTGLKPEAGCRVGRSGVRRFGSGSGSEKIRERERE